MAIGRLENEDDLFDWLKRKITTLVPPGNVQGQIAAAVDSIEFPNAPPPGSVFLGGWDTPPTGYLECDGSAVSRTGYVDLFAAIGTRFGAGDGSTTFNVPDSRGRVMVGKGTHADVNALGDHEQPTVGGLAVGDRTPYHQHNMNHSHTLSHTHGFTTGGTVAHQNVARDTHTHPESGGGTTGNNSANATVADSPHTHTGTTGGASDSTTSPPDSTTTIVASGAFLTLLAVIKT